MASVKQPLLGSSRNDTGSYNSVNAFGGQKQTNPHAVVAYRSDPLRWYILAVLCVMNISNAMVSLHCEQCRHQTAQLLIVCECGIHVGPKLLQLCASNASIAPLPKFQKNDSTKFTWDH